jgi:hypothetical protein
MWWWQISRPGITTCGYGWDRRYARWGGYLVTVTADCDWTAPGETCVSYGLLESAVEAGVWEGRACHDLGEVGQS